MKGELMMRTAMLAAVLVALVGVSPASASEIEVGTDVDVVANDGRCSLREAVQSASLDTASGAAAGECPAGEASVDVVRLRAGTYALSIPGTAENASATGDLDAFAGLLELRGAGRDRTIVSAAGIDRVLDVLAVATVTIADLTVADGVAPQGAAGAAPGEPGGAIRSAGTLTLERVAVRSSRAGRGGTGTGGTGGGAGGAGGAGGGIATDGQLTLTDVVVAGNRAGTGGLGGDGATAGGPGGPGGAGGGIHATGVTTITRSTIVANAAGDGGAGDSGAATIGGLGGAGGSGGGLSTAGQLDLVGTFVDGNRAGDGGRGGSAGTTGRAGGNGGNGGNLSSTGTATATSSTLLGGSAGAGGVGGGGALGGNGTAGNGAGLAGNPTLTASVITGSCSGAPVDGGQNLTALAGCPGAVGDPRLDTDGVPAAGSPALDAASACPATDLAGTARPQGATCDIGALETRAGTLTASPEALAFAPGPGTRTVSVTNPGLPALGLPVSVAGDPDFALAGHTCPPLLLGGARCEATISFTPVAVGLRTGVLRLGGREVQLSGFSSPAVAAASEPPCVVPRLRGKTIAAARRILARANCTLGAVTRRTGRGKAGRIRSTRPPAGTIRRPDAAVRVVVTRAARRAARGRSG
jgi:hypothetical protein